MGEHKWSYKSVNPKLGFVVKKSGIYKYSILCWLGKPDFEKELLAMVDNCESVDQASILAAMERVLARKPEYLETRLIRSGYHQLQRIVHPDSADS